MSPSGLRRPRSPDEILRTYPSLVLSMAEGRLTVTRISLIPPSDWLLQDKTILLNILVSDSDFSKIRDIASSFTPGVSPFPSEPPDSVLARARALIRVTFFESGGSSI